MTKSNKNSTSEKEIAKNKQINTISQCRLPVFAPTYRPPKHMQNPREEKIITPWGSVSIVGDLTQIHRDMLDWIFAKAQKHEKYDSVFLFSPRQMAKELGLRVKSGDYFAFLKDKFEEMRKARLSIETDKFVVFCGIVREHGYSKHKLNEAAKLGKKVFKDKLYFVVFETKYMLLLKSDIAMCYLPLVDDIIKIKSPVVKAFVRFVISHQSLKMYLGTILDAIGFIDISERKKIDKKKEILANKQFLFEKFRIYIDKEEIVSYTQKTPEIYFLFPESRKDEVVKEEVIVQKEIKLFEKKKPDIQQLFFF